MSGGESEGILIGYSTTTPAVPTIMSSVIYFGLLSFLLIPEPAD